MADSSAAAVAIAANRLSAGINEAALVPRPSLPAVVTARLQLLRPPQEGATPGERGAHVPGGGDYEPEANLDGQS